MRGTPVMRSARYATGAVICVATHPPANRAGAEVPAPVRHRWVMLALLGGELGPVAVAGVVALGLPVGGGGARRYVVIGLLAAALGYRTRPYAAWRSLT